MLGLGLLGMVLLGPVYATTNEVFPDPVAGLYERQSEVPTSCESPEQSETHPRPRIVHPPVSDEMVSRCPITAAELHQSQSGRPPLLVDLRPAREYDRAHIPGALNIAAPLLPFKTFARNRSVVLVDAGHRKQHLLRSCEQLIDKGFQRVHTLEGGLAAWASAGYDIQGTEPSMISLLSLKPRDVSVVLSEGAWILVLDPSTSTSLPQDLAVLPQVEWINDASSLANKVLAYNSAESAVPGILFISSENILPQTVVDLARQLPDRPVRIVTEGLAGIKTYRAQRVVRLAKPAGSALTRKRCGG